MMKLNARARPQRLSMGAIALLSVALFITPALAAIATFEIEPQDLSSALKAFAVQSHREIFFAPELARGRTSQGVKGKFDDLQALAMILQGTGLRFSVTTSNAILVRDPAGKVDASREAASQPSADGTNSREAGKQASPDFRVAQVDQNAAGPRAVGGDQRSESEKREGGLSEIVVTGTHIRGLADGASPVETLDRAAIDATGLTTIAQIMQTLPANSAAGINVQTRQVGTGVGHANDNRGYASAVNLYGLGSDATLVLLNGNRLPSASQGFSVDISAIPLSVIDHIDVLKDGASSIYGSDAVGGVVNFVTRKDFSGAETTANLGSVTNGNKTDIQASQLMGANWSSGNAMLAYNYDRQGGLSTRYRSCCDTAQNPSNVLPQSTMHSLYGAGRQEIDSGTRVDLDFLYSTRHVDDLGTILMGTAPDSSRTLSTSDAFLTNIAIERSLPREWLASVSGHYAKTSTSYTDEMDSLGAFPEVNVRNKGHTYSFDAKADGRVLELPGGASKVAVGVSYREEEYREIPTYDLNRTIRSAYGEVFIPVVGEPNGMTLLRRLEITASVRYDRYSDFGSTTNPKFGILWAPLADLKLRGTYSTSFRAPQLAELESGGGNDILLELPDSLAVGGQSLTLYRLGGNPGLRPETATNTTTGITWTPAELHGFRASADFFDVRFKHRIDQPGGGNTLIELDPAVYGAYLNHNPSASEVAGIVAGPTFLNAFGPFAPSDVQLIADDRLQNLSQVSVRGIDGKAAMRNTLGNGMLDSSIDATYLLKYQQTLIAGDPPIDRLNTPYYPVGLRLRAGSTWSENGLSVSGFLNHVKGYTDSRDPTTPHAVSPWTTVDAQLAYSFNADSMLGKSGIALSVQNLFDRAPPFVANSAPSNVTQFGFNYDPANASALGRFITLRLSHVW